MISGKPAAYTWILLDWKMPGMDGVACARLILKQHPELRPCILLVTAFAREDALRASAGLPLAGVLQKPVTPSSLHDCLLRAGAADPVHAALLSGTWQRRPLAEDLRERLSGARILLVEDHPLNQELASELLRRAGMEVAVADNGAEALRLLAQEPPFDCVLMDCQMPVMDGYTATARIREHADWQRLPVIAMTAGALAEDRDRALASGMDAHITKPIDVQLMLRTMAECMSARTASTEALPGANTPEPAHHGAAAAIDTADGLARCMGRLDLYQRVLRGFRDAEASYATEAPAAFAAERWADVLHRTHDLKGLAGTIGAMHLHALASQLHTTLAGSHPAAAEAELRGVCAELQVVLREIETLLPVA